MGVYFSVGCIAIWWKQNANELRPKVCIRISLWRYRCFSRDKVRDSTRLKDSSNTIRHHDLRCVVCKWKTVNPFALESVKPMILLWVNDRCQAVQNFKFSDVDVELEISGSTYPGSREWVPTRDLHITNERGIGEQSWLIWKLHGISWVLRKLIIL